MPSSTITVTSGDDYLEAGGEDRRLVVTVTKSGDTVDLTDTVPTFMVKRRRTDDDADALITKTIGSGVVLADQGTDEGVAYIEIAAADTADLAGTFRWELSAEDAVGTITLRAGQFVVKPDLIVGT